MPQTVDIVIITPLALEYQAVRRHLTHPHSAGDPGLVAEIGTFQGQHHTWRVAVCESGPKVAAVALCTERAIKAFGPRVAILTGIAGGVKDVGIGDVVVGTKAYGYESGKETDAGFLSRPNVLPANAQLLAHCRTVAKSDEWRRRLTHTPSAPPQVFFGPIASGDKVITSTEAPAYQLLKRHYNDTLALEMEAIGFAEAALPHDVRAINIRGVSDLLNGKTPDHDLETQPLATAHAAAFLFEVLNLLGNHTLNLPTMDHKTLVKDLTELLRPFLDEEKKTLAPNLPVGVQQVWQRVKSTYEDALKEEDSTEEALIVAKSNLRNCLEKEPTKAKWLADTVAELKASPPPPPSTQISHSKNVVTGQIQAGGNVHIGDTTTHSTHQQAEKIYNIKKIDKADFS